MMRSVESASSVFYHSQEETAADSQGSNRDALPAPLGDSYHDSMIDGGPATAEHDASGNYTAHAYAMKLSVAISRMCSVVAPMWASLAADSIREGSERMTSIQCVHLYSVFCFLLFALLPLIVG